MIVHVIEKAREEFSMNITWARVGTPVGSNLSQSCGSIGTHTRPADMVQENKSQNKGLRF